MWEPNSTENSIKKNVKYRKITEENILKLKNELSLINWDEILKDTDLNKNYDIFLDTLYNKFNLLIPTKYKSINPNFRASPWIDTEIKSMIRNKNAFYNLVLKNAISTDFYKDYCKELSKKIRQKKSKFMIERLKNSLDSSIEWKNLKSFLNISSKNSYEPVNCIKVNNVSINDKEEIVNTFNNHFASVGQKTSESIPFYRGNNYKNYLKTPSKHSFKLFEITEQEIIVTINSSTASAIALS